MTCQQCCGRNIRMLAIVRTNLRTSDLAGSAMRELTASGHDGTTLQNERSCVAQLGSFIDNNDSGASPVIHVAFDEQARRGAQRVALRYENESLTYGQLNRRADNLAAHLQSHAAVKR